MTPSARILLAAAALASAGVAAVPAAHAGDFAPGNRPHSKVATYDRGDIKIQRLLTSIKREGHRLRPTVSVILRNDGDQAITTAVRVGPCTGGISGYPKCPTQTSMTVKVPAHDTVSRVRKLGQIHQPPPRLDTVQTAVVRPSSKYPYGAAKPTYGFSILKGSAWRGEGRNHPYGIDAPGVATGAFERMNFDIPATSHGRAYIDVKWTGTSAPSATKTSISRCNGRGHCRPDAQDLPADPARSGTEEFGRRFDFDNDGAKSLIVQIAGQSTNLAYAELPWPG